MEPIAIGTRNIGAGAPTFILAEIGTNHDGSLDRALQLISLAAKAGADGVKFQLFRAQEMYPDNIGMVEVCGKPYDFYAYLKSTEMPVSWLARLKKRCRQESVALVVSAFDPGSLAVCVDAGVDAIKIASAEVNYFQLVDAAAASGLPVIASTGFSAMDDVINAVNWIRAQHNENFVLLQCTAAYPTPPQECHLAVMKTYEEVFDCQVGFSDHTMSWLDVPLIAAAQGACLIEKHFTDSRDNEGTDHAFAIEPKELETMIRAIHNCEPFARGTADLPVESDLVREVLGHSVKGISALEKDIYPCEKRFIRARRDIQPGETLDASNIGCLRFVHNGKAGLHTRHLAEVLGTVACRPIFKGEGVLASDFTPHTKPKKGSGKVTSHIHYA